MLQFFFLWLLNSNLFEITKNDLADKIPERSMPGPYHMHGLPAEDFDRIRMSRDIFFNWLKIILVLKF